MVIQNINKKAPVETVTEEVNLPQLGNLYTGNIMYIKPDVKNNPNTVYVQIMLRFMNFDEIEQVPVQLFTNKETFTAQVGDLVSFKARRLTNALDTHNNPIILPDGTTLLKASGLINGGELTVIKSAAPAAKLKTVGEIKSTGLKTLLSNFLGLK